MSNGKFCKCFFLCGSSINLLGDIKVQNASKLISKRLNNKNLGRLISRVSEPLIWIPLVLWFVLKKLSYPTEQVINDYLILLTFFFLIPLAYSLFIIFIKKDVDIDISDKSKRIKFALLPMASFAIGVGSAYFINKQFCVITFAAFMSTLVLVLITRRSKISYHSGLNAMYFCSINYLYNWSFWWLFLFLIPIGWGRWTLKKHSVTQLIAGIVASTSTFLLTTGTFMRLLAKI